MDKTQDTITEGKLSRPLFSLAWPIIITQLLQVAYNITDTIWLGRVSTSAVGALSLALPVSVLIISISGGFTVAGSTLVAQYTGADSNTSAGAIAGQTISFVAGLAIVLGIAGYFLVDPLLALYPAQQSTAETVVPMAGNYLRVLFLGTPFIFGFHVFSALMRGHGDTRLPMRVMTVSVLLNVVLDPLFIFGWGPIDGMAIQGAAIATVLSRGVATVIGVYVLFGTPYGPDVQLRHLVPDASNIWNIVRIGTPSALEESSGALAMLTLTAIIVTFAPPVIAAYGLGNRVVSLVFLPAVELGRATNTMVGQNLGARNVDRAEQAVWLAAKAGCAVMVVVAIIAALFADTFVGIFLTTGTPDADQTLQLAGEYLRIRTVEFAFIGLFHVLVGAYRGAGNTKTAMAFSMVTLWFCRVPAVYYLAIVRDLGPTGIWLGVAIGHIIGAIGAGLWFTRGTWKQAVISEPATSSQSSVED